MSDLSDRGRALEDKFFAERERQLLEALRAKAEAKESAEVLASETGIQDAPLLARMVALGVRADTLAAFAVVPLLHVAWGDDLLDTAEREAIEREALGSGISRESGAFTLLSAWLTREPNRELFDAWKQFHADLAPLLTGEEREALAADLLGRCERVARASGGILGIGAVSASERAALAELRSILTGA